MKLIFQIQKTQKNKHLIFASYKKLRKIMYVFLELENLKMHNFYVYKIEKLKKLD
eukprot:UN24332